MDTRHEVFNPPGPLSGYNLFEGNQALRDALKLNASGLDKAALSHLGFESGTAKMQAHVWLVNTRKPKLHTHNRLDRRLVQDAAPALQTSRCTVASAFCNSRLTGHWEGHTGWQRELRPHHQPGHAAPGRLSRTISTLWSPS